MNKNSMSYKTSQFLMFAGVSTVLFCGVVIIPFVYGLYLTFTSWDVPQQAFCRLRELCGCVCGS